MTGNDRPDGRNDDEMIAESRLDYLLDTVEAPEPSVVLRNRIHDLGAGLVRLPPRSVRPPRRTTFREWLRDSFGGMLLRPVALGCALLVGIVVGHTLPVDAPVASDPAPTIATVEPSEPQVLVTANLIRPAAGPDALSVQGYSLVMPRATLLTAAELAESGDESGLGNLPLY